LGWVLAQLLVLISLLGSGIGFGDTSLFLGLLCGVGIPVALLMVEPYKRNPNIKFNAFQGLFVSGLVLCLYIVLRILVSIMLSSMSLFMIDVVRIYMWVYAAVPLALCAILALKAFNNQRWVLPIIGPIAEKQAYK
jgi:uncharacterized membrane protein